MLIFSHIPKTAGTSVVKNLARFAEVVKLYNVRPYELPRIKLGFINAGHYGILDFLKNPTVLAGDREITLLSIVRDPVDRLISTYNYVSASNTHPLHEWTKTLSSESCLLEFSAREANIQTKYLTGDVSWRIVVSTLEHVADAASQALNMTAIAKSTPADFEERYNETKLIQRRDTKSISRASLHPGLIDYLYEKQERDVEIYNRVKKLGVMYSLPT